MHAILHESSPQDAPVDLVVVSKRIAQSWVDSSHISYPCHITDLVKAFSSLLPHSENIGPRWNSGRLEAGFCFHWLWLISCVDNVVFYPSLWHGFIKSGFPLDQPTALVWDGSSLEDGLKFLRHCIYLKETVINLFIFTYISYLHTYLHLQAVCFIVLAMWCDIMNFSDMPMLAKDITAWKNGPPSIVILEEAIHFIFMYKVSVTIQSLWSRTRLNRGVRRWGAAMNHQGDRRLSVDHGSGFCSFTALWQHSYDSS